MRARPAIRIRVEDVEHGTVIRLDLHRHPGGGRRVLVDRDRLRSSRCGVETVSGVYGLLREWTAARLWA